MDNAAVANASPLILLSRSGHLELLHCAAEKILVPETVAREILARGPQDPGGQALTGTPWIGIVPAPPVPEAIIEWDLGAGESSVLAMALGNPGMEAIIDDLAGRRCATSLRIPVRGTLGVVLVAKKRGLIPAARPVMEVLIRSGLYLSRSVLDQALQRVGE